MVSNEVLVFVSYSSPDRERVLSVVEHLEAAGVDAWIDCKRILPGQNWDFEIKKALASADICVVFLSSVSLSRRGYVQREIREILDRYQETLIDDIYIIPILLDPNLQVPADLARFQWVSITTDGYIDQILKAIDHQINRLGRARRAFEKESGITWSVESREGVRDGTPGEEYSIDVLHLSSERHQAIKDISKYVNGIWAGQLVSSSTGESSSPPDWWIDAPGPPNTIFSAKCAEPSIVGDILSIVYTVSVMPARGVHPNSHFESFNFDLTSGSLIRPTESLFTDQREALSVISTLVRSVLRSKGLHADMVDRGTQTWANFKSVRFRDSGLDFLFGDYAVASYAEGSQIAHIPYSAVIHLLEPRILRLLRLT